MLLILVFVGLKIEQGGKERLKKETDHSRLEGIKFNKQGNLGMRLVLSGCKMNRSLPPPTRILKKNREKSLNWVQSTWPQQHFTLSGLCPWNISHCGNQGQSVHSKHREGVRSR